MEGRTAQPCQGLKYCDSLTSFMTPTSPSPYCRLHRGIFPYPIPCSNEKAQPAMRVRCINHSCMPDKFQWLPKFGTYSQRLRNAIVHLAEWLSNDNPPCYRALMAGRLIALVKNPGVRPIAIGEVLRRLFAKCVLSVVKGLQAGIEGGVHAMHSYGRLARSN